LTLEVFLCSGGKSVPKPAGTSDRTGFFHIGR
jgi:hypothetical protein